MTNNEVVLEKNEAAQQEFSIVKIGIATIRKGGFTNMFNRTQVQYYAFKLGFFELVTFIEENKDDLISYMSEIDFENCPYLPNEIAQEIIEWNYSEFEAREIVNDYFEKEVEKYARMGGMNYLFKKSGQLHMI